MNGPPLTIGWWLAATAPVAVLLVAVLGGRIRTQWAATGVLGLALVLGATAFRAGPVVLATGLAKGLWLGLWILLVVWPALLLYRLAQAGGLDDLGEIFTSILPTRRENLLIVAWILPSFVQGVAGFGTPIAVTAPLLMAMGWSPVRAVAYPLIGYHWSVTFGSMGSSFYMASLTASLDGAAQADLALRSAVLLGINCLVAGGLVLVLDGGLAALREGLRTLLLAGIPMATTLIVVATAVPAVASLSAGAVGIGAAAAIAAHLSRRDRAAATTPADDGDVDVTSSRDPSPAIPSRQERRRAAIIMAPYGYLLAIALPVFLLPATRAWVNTHASLAPSFRATSTAWQWSNDAVEAYTPIDVFAHPGFYIFAACALGFVTYRHAALVDVDGVGDLLAAWVRSLPAASASIVLLAALATVMTDTGMIAVLADGVAQGAGGLYPALAPVVGGLGSFMTGSTTSSNALFAALQADVAELLELPPSLLIAAQTAGGNAGNSLAPVIILVGATAVDASDETASIMRFCLLPAGVLLAIVAALTLLGV
ncbi:MAG: L-lactate permease [Actinobacteria bacterium]|nr:L-lactate permease [Actinomycetota bacterium]